MEKSETIRRKRIALGLTQRAFALMLGLNDNGEKAVADWERGKSSPTATKWKLIENLDISARFAHHEDADYKFLFIDLFAGIGGIRLPYQGLGGKCVFSSEWDKFAQRTYTKNFGEAPHGDITQISASSIPDHDVLLAGFPCQTFSQAGLKKGFDDTRGTMFFEIQRILAEKRPKAFMLENVKQLKGHDKGRTLETILSILRGEHEQDIPANVPMSEESREALSKKLNYWVDFKVLRAADFGVPQNRERIFIVGFDQDYYKSANFDELFQWPEPIKSPTRLGDILEDSATLDPKYTLSEKLWAGHLRRKEEHGKKGNGFGYRLFNENSPYTNTISARYYKDGSEILIDQSHLGKRPRKLTPRECARLQGFPENYDLSAVSDVQMYKQFGNSVSVPVIEAVAKQLINTLEIARN